MHTNLLELLAVPEVEEIIERVVPGPCGHLAGGQTCDVEFCPRRLDTLPVRQPKASSVAQRVHNLAQLLMSVAVELRETAKEILYYRDELGEVVAETRDEVAKEHADDVIRERTFK